MTSKDSILCVPLGGCGQFGANMTLYGHDGEWLAIDCGIGFADEHLPGVDILMPDIDWIAERAQDLKGLIITHAHEDHVGAVAWMWPRLKCPIYTSPFTAAVLRRKLDEHVYAEEPEIHEIEIGSDLNIGTFTVHSAAVTHSIPETMSLMVETAAGSVVHTGDWNLDPNPVVGSPTDIQQFSKWGDQGVLAVIGDSTNAPVPGRSQSESEAAAGLEAVFSECKGKIAITIFSSNIGRILSIVQAAKANDRHVALIGRSLKNMAQCAQEAGYIPDNLNFVSEKDIGNLPNDKQVLIVTGSQGEPRAALSKIARGVSNDISLGAGDTVIFSARSIPGNERGILDVKNLLAASGVRVIDPDVTDEVIHVSGHPRQDEIRDLYKALRPQIVVPVHGEYQMQHAHAKLAEAEFGCQTLIPRNGYIMRLSAAEGVALVDQVDITPHALDMGHIVPVTHIPLQQRRRLSFNGALFLSLVIEEDSLELIDLQLTPLGLVDEEHQNDVIEDVLDRVEGAYERMKNGDKRNAHKLADTVRIAARKPFKDKFRVRPVTEVHVVYV